MALNLYLDDCSNSDLLADLLRQAGHRVVRPTDEGIGLEGEDDPVHLGFAAAHGLRSSTRSAIGATEGARRKDCQGRIPPEVESASVSSSSASGVASARPAFTDVSPGLRTVSARSPARIPAPIWPTGRPSAPGGSLDGFGPCGWRRG